MSGDGRIFRARHAMGRRVCGTALVAHDGFSARYDLDRIAGVFSRPAHKLAGFDEDITAAIPNGAELEIDPETGIVTVPHRIDRAQKKQERNRKGARLQERGQARISRMPSRYPFEKGPGAKREKGPGPPFPP